MPVQSIDPGVHTPAAPAGCPQSAANNADAETGPQATPLRSLEDDPRAQKAIAVFNERIETILGMTAMQIARRSALGIAATGKTGALDENQKKRVGDALTNLLLDLPFSGLPPYTQLRARKNRPACAPYDPNEDPSLREFLGDHAKAFVEDLEKNMPFVYYSLRTFLTVKIGSEQGSEALEKYDLALRYKRDIFEGRLQAGLTAIWEPGFIDPGVRLNIRTPTIDNGIMQRTFEGSVSVVRHDGKAQLKSAEGVFSLRRDAYLLRISRKRNTDDLSAEANAQLLDPQPVNTLTYALSRDFELGTATLSHIRNLNDGRVNLRLEGEFALQPPRKGARHNIAVFAEHGLHENGDPFRIGIGWRADF